MVAAMDTPALAAGFKRVSDPEVEKQGMIFYADGDWLELKADFHPQVNSEAVFAYLAHRHIVEGLDQGRIEALVDLARSGTPVSMETIARGRPPRFGKDGRLEFLIDRNPKKVEIKDAQGNVSYRDLNMIHEVRKEGKILRVIAPVPAENGVSVQGMSILASGGDRARLALGKNVIEQDGIVHATVDGHVEFVDPLISVSEVFVVSGDVDLSTGNLRFVGNITVEGNVMDGFTLEAGGSIEIKGVATACTLTAQGDIIVSQGVHGQGKSQIRCGGEFSAGFVNDADIQAHQGVALHKEIVRTSLRTMGKVVVKNGEIRGGEVDAFAGVEVKELGSPMGTPTTVIVGVNHDVGETIAREQQGLEKLQADLKKLADAIAPYLKNKLLLAKASEGQKRAVLQVTNKLKEGQERVKAIEAKFQELELQRYDKGKEIKVSGGILPNVSVQIGKKKRKFTDANPRPGVVCYDKASFDVVFAKI